MSPGERSLEIEVIDESLSSLSSHKIRDLKFRFLDFSIWFNQNYHSKKEYIKINLKNNCKIICIDLNCINCFNKYNNYLDDHFESYW